jgi:rhodanese-related sulfurtransferase
MRTMRKLELFLVLTFVLAMIGKSQPIAEDYKAKLKELYKNTVPVIQPAELALALDQAQKPILLDTRTKAEFDVSHIRDARFADFETFSAAAVKDIPKSQPIVVYCSVGYRSERIGEKLLALGYTRVYNLYGGIFEWVNEHHSVDSNLHKPTSNVHGYSKDWGKWLRRGHVVYTKIEP